MAIGIGSTWNDYEEYIKIKLIKDYNDWYYAIPNRLYDDFLEDRNELNNEELYKKYSRYFLGEDINEIQLYRHWTY